MDENHLERPNWQGGVPVSPRFDDPYYSLENGLAETRHVFLDGNDLPARFAPGFVIAELGFGTGLNMLAALQAWIASGTPGPLFYHGFEAFPMPVQDMARALSAFPDLQPLVPPLLNGWREDRRMRTIDNATLRATITIADARLILPNLAMRADAWFLDGFSPAKNPELWEPELMRNVARCTAPGGTLSTYTAAGHVRRALAEAGFVVERRPGFGRKRHMTAGRLP